MRDNDDDFDEAGFYEKCDEAKRKQRNAPPQNDGSQQPMSDW